MAKITSRIHNHMRHGSKYKWETLPMDRKKSELHQPASISNSWLAVLKAHCRQPCLGLAQGRPTSNDLIKLGSKLCRTCICGSSVSGAVAPTDGKPVRYSNTELHLSSPRWYQNCCSCSENTVKVNTIQTSQKKMQTYTFRVRNEANTHPHATSVCIHELLNQNLTLRSRSKNHS